MDLAHLRAHPERLATYLFHQRIRETPVRGGSICQARRLTLEDGSSLFAKSRESAPAGFFEAEATGLRWLGEAPGGVAVPEVIAALPDLLALGWVEPGEPSLVAAERFGWELAQTHRAGADAFGAPWQGFIGSLPQDNTTAGAGWAEWFATRRLEPYLRMAADRGALGTVGECRARPAEFCLFNRRRQMRPVIDEPPAHRLRLGDRRIRRPALDRITAPIPIQKPVNPNAT